MKIDRSQESALEVVKSNARAKTEDVDEQRLSEEFLKIGFEEKKNEYFIRVEGSKELGILYGNLVQYPCSNNTNKYNIVAIDVSYFSPITEGEYNKHNGLISAETITLDTILTY
jgi:hypothetical protein